MNGTLFDRLGHRKYLATPERLAFVTAALEEENLIASFCLTMVVTGARISEVLALTGDRIDGANEAIIFETLKRRRGGVFRAVPVPPWLLNIVVKVVRAPDERVWPWGRTTGWKVVKSVMRKAGIAEYLCQPKALRHTLGVEAGQRSVPLNIVQRWLGHARIETTAIYASALGEEERNLARRVWAGLEGATIKGSEP
jgi:integrase/recombinase XerD